MLSSRHSCAARIKPAADRSGKTQHSQFVRQNAGRTRRGPLDRARVNRLWAARIGALKLLSFATRKSYVMVAIDREEQPAAPMRHERTLVMIFDNIVSRARTSIAKRRHYNRLVSEIENLSSRDLADLRADRSEMLYQIHKQIYG
jgi:hypothetical protein